MLALLSSAVKMKNLANSGLVARSASTLDDFGGNGGLRNEARRKRRLKKARAYHPGPSLFS